MHHLHFERSTFPAIPADGGRDPYIIAVMERRAAARAHEAVGIPTGAERERLIQEAIAAGRYRRIVRTEADALADHTTPQGSSEIAAGTGSNGVQRTHHGRAGSMAARIKRLQVETLLREGKLTNREIAKRLGCRAEYPAEVRRAMEVAGGLKGRPRAKPKLNKEQLKRRDDVRALLLQGKTHRQVMAAMNCGKWLVCAVAADLKAEAEGQEIAA